MLKQTTAMFTFVKKKEVDEEADIYTFVGMNTLPDRVPDQSKSGESTDGEILAKTVLDKVAGFINDETKLGGNSVSVGSYRTVSLFHDRVYEKDYKLEEAGFVVPGSAIVQEMEISPGNYEMLVDIEVNKHYKPTSYPDYTPEKINYKIQKGAIGISMEFNNRADQERIVEVGEKKYNYVFDTDDFRGFGFARANLIGNPGAVRVKEVLISKELKTKEGDTKMEEEAKLKEMEKQLTEANAKVKELEEEKKAAEEAKDEGKVDEVDKKVEEVKKEVADVEEKVKEAKLAMDSTAAKIKESVELGFSSLDFKKPANTPVDDKNAKIKEVYEPVETKDFTKFKERAMDLIDSDEQYLSKFKEMVAEGAPGYPFEKYQTLKVKCVGNGSGQMIVIPSVKTKDVIDATDMAESTYYQTNAMFADRYVAGITETFLMEDSLLTAIPKEQHIGGNDKYQWKLQIDYETVTGDNTMAVNPNVTAVARSKRKFENMETRICEYRDGVEVTDFTQYHSMAAIGDLLGKEIERAAQVVTESMNADLFKPKVDNTTAWWGFNGLLGIADSSTYSTCYGKVRSATNRLLDDTTANTYVSTSEAMSIELFRDGYEKVLAHGSSFGSIVGVMHPTQMRRLWNTEDAAIRNQILTMAGAPPTFGFNRAVVPYIDGVPVIRDYRCESSANAADCFGIVDFNPSKGFVLVVSKPLGARGLAKVGTSESAYVNFWGCSVYKSPRNIFMHDSLTTS